MIDTGCDLSRWTFKHDLCNLGHWTWRAARFVHLLPFPCVTWGYSRHFAFGKGMYREAQRCCDCIPEGYGVQNVSSLRSFVYKKTDYVSSSFSFYSCLLHPTNSKERSIKAILLCLRCMGRPSGQSSVSDSGPVSSPSNCNTEL